MTLLYRSLFVALTLKCLMYLNKNHIFISNGRLVECGKTLKSAVVEEVPLLRNVNQVCQVAPVFIDNSNVLELPELWK